MKSLIKTIFQYRHIKNLWIYVSISFYSAMILAPRAQAENSKSIETHAQAERLPDSYHPVLKKTKSTPEDESKIKSQLIPINPSDASPSQGVENFGITGDWEGLRNDLDANGVSLGVIYKGEASQVLSGGLDRKNAFLQNLDIKLLIDANKLLEWKGTSFFIYGIGDWGASQGFKPTLFVGDEQGTSNIETSADTFKLYEIWIQQKFAEEQASVLFGIHDLNSEFYVTDSSTLFLNSSFGIGRELSQTGLMGPSIFPSTTMALRLKIESTNGFYLQTGVFNALAGDVNSASKVNFTINSSDGFLLINEVGFNANEDQISKYALGYWAYTRTFADLSVQVTDGVGNSVPRQVNSSGAYLLFDQSLTAMTSLFFRYGVASTGSNFVKDDIAGGVVLLGPISTRPEDKLGLAFTRVSSNSGNQPAECAYELSYRIELAQGLALQPDLQYIINPGFSEDNSRAFVGGLRLEVGF